MARTPHWKPQGSNTLIGERIERLDGVEKASGNAKYTYDVNPKGTLFAKLLTCKHGHAKVAKLNIEPANRLNLVTEELNSQRVRFGWRKDVNNTATNTDLTGQLDRRNSIEPPPHEPLQERI